MSINFLLSYFEIFQKFKNSSKIHKNCQLPASVCCFPIIFIFVSRLHFLSTIFFQMCQATKKIEKLRKINCVLLKFTPKLSKLRVKKTSIISSREKIRHVLRVRNFWVQVSRKYIRVENFSWNSTWRMVGREWEVWMKRAKGVSFILVSEVKARCVGESSSAAKTTTTTTIRGVLRPGV